MLKVGGKAIRFQRFCMFFIAPMMGVLTGANWYWSLNIIDLLIVAWVGLAISYTIAECVRRLVLGELMQYIPPAGESDD